MTSGLPGFDPRRLGAQCDRCYLFHNREGGPTESEHHDTKVALIGEAPGREEVEQNRPFVGASGRELTTSLASVGRARDSVSFVNAILCRPPGNDLDTLLHRCQQENKKREAAGEEPWLTPIEACRPRMLREIDSYSQIITVGKIAFRATTQQTNSIMDVRGAPVTGLLTPLDRWEPRETLDPTAADEPFLHGGSRFVRLMPTIHPAFVMRARRWTKVFRTDLARAFRWFNGSLGWKEPKSIFTPTLSQARDFLYSGAPFYAYDVETDAKESLTARLRCVGVATPDAGIVIPFLSIDGQTHFYPYDDEEAMKDLLRAWFTDRRIVKAGWNAGMYDRIVMEMQLGVTPAPLVDGIIVHHNVDSELPHNLAFVGALFTDVARAWKASHAATNAGDDRELHVYNLYDAVVNARIMQPLLDAAAMKGQSEVVLWDHKAQMACAGYHKNGMYVDQAVRRQLDEKYRREAAEHRRILRMTVGDEDFNPNSVPTVRKILFERWALTPLETTALGDPSTNDDTLRKLLLLPHLRNEQKDFLRSMRKFRRAVKFRGTFLRPLRPWNEPVFQEDDLSVDLRVVEEAALVDEVAQAVEDNQGDLSPRAIRRAIDKAMGLVLGDGRVHANWNAHVATTGRKSSSNPNLQNFPRPLRVMFVAEDGRAFAFCDYDQLELRIASALAGAKRYLEAFEDPNGDPHAVTAEMIYGSAFRHGSDSDRKRIRDFAKRFVYAVIYKAAVETIHDTISAAENENGELVFPWITLRETNTLYSRWLRENPEFEGWWERCLDDFRRDGCISDVVFGRKRFFLDGEDPNEIINFGVQTAGASCCTKAEIALMEGPIPFEKWGPGTGLVHNGHDALGVEAPCQHLGPGRSYKWPKGTKLPAGNVHGHPPLGPGERCPVVDAALTVSEAMTMRLPGYSVLLTAAPKVGYAWSDC